MAPLAPQPIAVDASAATDAAIPFYNTYARLPERFYARVNPTPVASPRLVKLNIDLARDLGLDPDQLSSHEGIEILGPGRGTTCAFFDVLSRRKRI